MEGITLRTGLESDAPAIVEFYLSATGRQTHDWKIAEVIREFPSATALGPNGDLAGFAYTRRFAPDILELLNLFVAPEYRRQGIATALLRHIEAEAAGRFAAIILVNSDLYKATNDAAGVSRFYERNGYTKSFETKASRVFTRVLI